MPSWFQSAVRRWLAVAGVAATLLSLGLFAASNQRLWAWFTFAFLFSWVVVFALTARAEHRRADPLRRGIDQALERGANIRNERPTNENEARDFRDRVQNWHSTTFRWIEQTDSRMSAEAFGDVTGLKTEPQLPEAFNSDHNYMLGRLDRYLQNLRKLRDSLP